MDTSMDMFRADYEVDGQKVVLTKNSVVNFLTRGNGKVTDQEVLFFINQCKAQKLNPLTGTDVYLIKYGSSPAQMVIGKSAYLKRAFKHPGYLYKEDGVVVEVKGTITKKEGACVYPSEKLLGGWCRVHYLKAGVQCYAYKEVSLAEYSSGQANWKSKPALMINKVAISQCVRDAFPEEYSGLYADDELVASGVIPADYEEVTETSESDRIEIKPSMAEATKTEPTVEAVNAEPTDAQETSEEPLPWDVQDTSAELATQEQKKAFLCAIAEHYSTPEERNAIYAQTMDKIGLKSIGKATVGEIEQAMKALGEIVAA